MSPQEKLEFELLKKDMLSFKRAISVEAGRIILEKPVMIRGTLSINGITIYTGTGTPSIDANVGSLYCRLDGPTTETLYIKEAGGWSAAA